MKHIRDVLAELCADRGFPSADNAPYARRCPVTAGRDTAPSGVPARLYRVGGEGIRLRCAHGVSGGVSAALQGEFFRQAGRFFAVYFTPFFFAASVVAPPESLIDETAPQKTGSHLGY